MSRAEAELREEALVPWAGFDELVRAEQAPLLRIAWRFTRDAEDARDLVQAAFVDAYAHRASLTDPATTAAWLRRILVNRAINQHRRRRVWSALHHLLRPSAGRGDDPDAALDRSARLRRIQERLRTLPARQAAAFTLRYFEGLGLDEVADAMGIDRGTVRVHLYRALKSMKELPLEEPDDV